MTRVLIATLLVQIWALTATSWALGEAVVDASKVHAAGIGNGRRLYAHGAVRRELLRLAEIGLFTVAAWQLLARAGGGEPSAFARLILSLFLAGQLMIAINSLLDLRLWRRLRHEHRQQI